jgi:hypothetical protein
LDFLLTSISRAIVLPASPAPTMSVRRRPCLILADLPRYSMMALLEIRKTPIEPSVSR